MAIQEKPILTHTHTCRLTLTLNSLSVFLCLALFSSYAPTQLQTRFKLAIFFFFGFVGFLSFCLWQLFVLMTSSLLLLAVATALFLVSAAATTAIEDKDSNNCCLHCTWFENYAQQVDSTVYSLPSKHS